MLLADMGLFERCTNLNDLSRLGEGIAVLFGAEGCSIFARTILDSIGHLFRGVLVGVFLFAQKAEK